MIVSKYKSTVLVYNKASKQEIKTYARCSFTNEYCYKLKLYTRQSDFFEIIFNDLTTNTKKKVSSLYHNNLYTTINNVTKCAVGKINTTRTCRINRKFLPKELIKIASKQLKKTK
ncbi:hypothetical protein CDIK_1492 [Cucumispora dikerogammari]|nr:hypothetical protein CDIK_1492 [Cucumispora dikerogammari]